MNFVSRLEKACARQRSHLCVGLDPDFDKVHRWLRQEILQLLRAQPLRLDVVSTDPEQQAPASLKLDPEQLVDEPEIAKDLACELVVRATAPFSAAFKPNAAFFELHVGAGVGVPALVRQMNAEHLVIFDGKRGDIANTSRQYAEAIFLRGGFDAVTVNPLMGWDAVEPFLAWPDRGAFLLCLTSNPGAQDFLLKNDLYLKIAEKAVAWNRAGNVGLVVGATHPEHAARVRAVAPELPLLIPGIGAQGGKLDEILDAIEARRNPRFLVNASRSIMFPEADPADIVRAMAEAARQLRDEIARFLRAGSSPGDPSGA